MSAPHAPTPGKSPMTTAGAWARSVAWNACAVIKAFSETDFTEDLKKFDLPTLIVHGDDDQIVPIGAAAHASAKLIRGATLKVYSGAPHGLADTHKQQLNTDLLAFIET
jgi:non-heme chloroperoxidase